MMNVATLSCKKPETEVSPKAKRRRYSAKYKARILKEASECRERGELGALLRREGLYSSILTQWRQQADAGQLKALEPKKRGPEPKVEDERDRRIAQLERENARLARRAERAEALVEVQKKVSEILGIVLPKVDEPEEP